MTTYTDRPGLRQKLEEQLHDHIDALQHKSQIVVVYGLGGAGKTQLVLDYIQQHRQSYSAVFWVEATSPETIERDYLQIYILLHNIDDEASHDAIQLQQAIPAVKRWFYGRSKRWLFVFDNADSISNPQDPSYVDLRRFLPDDPSIQIIVTSRDQLAVGLSELSAVEVDNMQPDEALSLFQKQSKISLTTSQQIEQVGAIVQELGYLALAITLAGSYIAATPRLRNNLTGYLPEYRERRKALLMQRPTWLVHQYGESILTTWETTYRAIEGQKPEACQFLTLLSFFTQDDIPIQFPINQTDDEVPRWTTVLFPGKQVDRYDLEEFLGILAGFSLIKYHEDQSSYSMHSLVQAWAYNRLEDLQQQHYSTVAALLSGLIADSVEDASIMIRARSISHVVSACQHIVQCFSSTSIEHEFLIEVLTKLALFQSKYGHFKDAMAMQRIVLREYQIRYGENNPITLYSMHNLVATLKDAGELQQALSMQRTVLSKLRLVLGEDHRDTLIAMNLLGIILGLVGETQEVLSVRRVVLLKCRQVFGEDHPKTLMAMGNLASTLRDTGKLQEALSMQRLMMIKLQQTLGKDHPDTLLAMNNLGTILRRTGQLQEALPMQRTILVKHQQILGEDHPDTLMAMNNLATTLQDVGELQEAILMQRTTLAKSQQILGENHPTTLLAMNNLAIVLGNIGELQEAISIQRAALVKHQQILGENHPTTLLATSNLATTLEDIGDLQEGISMQRATLVKSQQILGEDHPDTLTVMNNLATALGNIGELQEALSMQQETVKRRVKVLGPEHPYSVNAQNNLQHLEAMVQNEAML